MLKASQSALFSNSVYRRVEAPLLYGMKQRILLEITIPTSHKNIVKKAIMSIFVGFFSIKHRFSSQSTWSCVWGLTYVELHRVEKGE